MANVVVDLTYFPTIETITNLVRSDVRDDMAGATDTVGEGQILVNDLTVSVTMANLFNSAVREVARKLRIAQAPMLIHDNYIIYNIPPMNGPLGFQVADPAVQVEIAFNGYFDGTLWHKVNPSQPSPPGVPGGGSYALPQDVFQVIRLWERENKSNDVFCDMGEPSDGLAGVYQTNGFGRWEWRQDRICLPGSLDYRDLRLRYTMMLSAYFVQHADPKTTYVQLLDSEEAIARTIEKLYAARQGGQLYEMRKAEADAAIYDLVNEQVHRRQGTNYPTNAYGNEAPPVLNYGQ
jgi:hypothetical protein